MDLKEVQNSDQNLRHPWETVRFEVMYKLLCSTVDWNKITTVLDVGSGDLYVCRQLALKHPHLQIFAIDNSYGNISENQKTKWVKDSNIQCFESLDELPEIKTDLILMMDVLEHIQEDELFLSQLVAEAMVTPNTQLFITVPAYQALFTAHDHYLGHFRRYQKETLLSLLKQSGLEVQKHGAFFVSLLLIRFLQKLKEVLLGAKEQQGLNAQQFRPSSSRFIERMLRLDFYKTQIFEKIGLSLPGLSLYAICRKPAP